ncbi:MAG: hypothetical protein ABSF44_15640 [Candidatus Bathyarchaeia archaeon]|jgi:hypothetical protein
MTSEEFDNFWQELTRRLYHKKTAIKNWTVFHQVTGEDFEAEYEGGAYILVYPQPPAKTQRIPKVDFKVIFENWDQYLSGEIKRSEFAHGPIAQSRFTKYTISIIHGSI